MNAAGSSDKAVSAFTFGSVATDVDTGDVFEAEESGSVFGAVVSFSEFLLILRKSPAAIAIAQDETATRSSVA